MRYAVIGAVCALAARSYAAPDDYLSRLGAQVQKRLDELAAARAPQLTPPTPVAVTWRAVRVGSIDLGTSLVAFTAGDLDGDGKGELYAVTAREVIGVAMRGGKLVEIGRVPFEGDAAVPAPRDVVGTATVDGKELVAASSAFAKDLHVTLAKGKLAAQAGTTGFVVCTGERVQLVPGRNYFTGDTYGARCRDLVDRTGAQVHVRAQLAVNGKLTVGTAEYPHAGTAFEIADVDHDGTPEVILSGYVAPGDPDAVKVYAVGADEKKPMFHKRFNGGVVGIAVLDNGTTVAPTIVVAVRLAGATRVDLWRLD